EVAVRAVLFRAVEPTRLAGRGREDPAVDTVDDLTDHLTETPRRPRVEDDLIATEPTTLGHIPIRGFDVLDAQPLPGRLGVERKLQSSAGPHRIVLHSLGRARAAAGLVVE